MSGARAAYRLTLAAYCTLLFGLLIWNAWIVPSRQFPVALVLIVLVVPLLFPLPGLLHGRRYTFAWSTFLALFYFALGVVEIVSNPAERIYGIGMTVSALTWFSAAIVYIRCSGHETASR